MKSPYARHYRDEKVELEGKSPASQPRTPKPGSPGRCSFGEKSLELGPTDAGWGSLPLGCRPTPPAALGCCGPVSLGSSRIQSLLPDPDAHGFGFHIVFPRQTQDHLGFVLAKSAPSVESPRNPESASGSKPRSPAPDVHVPPFSQPRHHKPLTGPRAWGLCGRTPPETRNSRVLVVRPLGAMPSFLRVAAAGAPRHPLSRPRTRLKRPSVGANA